MLLVVKVKLTTVLFFSDLLLLEGQACVLQLALFFVQNQSIAWELLNYVMRALVWRLIPGWFLLVSYLHPRRDSVFSQDGSLFKPVCDEAFKPTVGMRFDDIASVEAFYKNYAHHVGFVILTPTSVDARFKGHRDKEKKA